MCNPLHAPTRRMVRPRLPVGRARPERASRSRAQSARNLGSAAHIVAPRSTRSPWSYVLRLTSLSMPLSTHPLVRARVPVGALALSLALSLAVVLWVHGRARDAEGPTRADIERQADALRRGLREHTAGLEARTRTLAELPWLAAAVATDAATVRELTTDELSLRPQPDEVIELVQVAGTTRTPLLRLPGAAPVRPVPSAPGLHATLAADALVLTAVAQIIPPAGPPVVPPGVTGLLAVSRATPAARLLPDLPAGARLELRTGTAVLPLGRVIPAGAARAEIPVAIGADTLVLVGALGAPAWGPAWPLRGAALVLALGGLLSALPRRRAARAAGQPTSPRPAPAAPPPARAAVPTPATAPSSDDAVGRYHPVRTLGTGASGTVHLARAVGAAGFETLVALKQLHPGLARDPATVKMFLDEARTASNLTHPNIVHIFDLGRVDDTYVIAMEYVEGGDLEGLLTRLREENRPVPLAVALAILRRMCAGLDAAHTAVDIHGRRLDIVHRDVKPANVLLSHAGAVKIADFGIAKAAHQLHHSEIGIARGTIAFMAPEQRMGRAVDARADVFSVGAVAYELLAGIQVDLDLERLLQQGPQGWPHLPPLCNLRPDAPAALVELVFRALAFDPEARPASCAVLEEELGAIVRAHDLELHERALGAWLASELRAAG